MTAHNACSDTDVLPDWESFGAASLTTVQGSSDCSHSSWEGDSSVAGGSFDTGTCFTFACLESCGVASQVVGHGARRDLIDISLQPTLVSRPFVLGQDSFSGGDVVFPKQQFYFSASGLCHQGEPTDVFLFPHSESSCGIWAASPGSGDDDCYSVGHEDCDIRVGLHGSRHPPLNASSHSACCIGAPSPLFV